MAASTAVPPYVVVVNAGSKYAAKKLNIDGGDDPFGRYQVPQLLCQVVGKGKMIKTMLLNIDVVAAALHTEPAYISAWLGYEIGASAKYEGKKPERERGSVSGNYSSELLSTHMKKFIREVILCQKCNLPELHLSLKGKRDPSAMLSCDSCGASYKLTRISAKFKKFIVNNPPAPAAAKDKSAERKKKEIAAAQKDATAAAAAAADGQSPVDPDAPAPVLVVDAATGELVNLDELAEAAAAAAAAAASSSSSDAAAQQTDVQWAVDASEAAAAARQAALLPDAVKLLIGSAIDENAAWIDAACTDVKEIIETGVARSRAPQEILELVFARVFDAARTPDTFAPALKHAIASFAPVFDQEPDFQPAFLDVLASFVAASPDLLPRAAAVFQLVVNEGLVEDDHIDAWWAAKQHAYGEAFSANLADFIEWLKQDDDDASEDAE